MSTTPAPTKKAAPATPPPLRPVAGASIERGNEVIPPAVDPLVDEGDAVAPRPFNIGDRVEFTDSVRFQFGAQKTLQAGKVIGVIAGEGMMIVGVEMEDPMAYDAPRVEFVLDGQTSVMRKLEVSDGD